PSHQPSRTHASHWFHVTGVVDIANGREKVISCWTSLSRRIGSSGGEPIVNVPGGSTIISGQLRHSLKVRPGVASSTRGFAAEPEPGCASKGPAASTR